MHVCPFHPDHLLSLSLVPLQGFMEQCRTDPAWRRQFFYPALSQTAVSDGKIIACYGIVPYIWAGRGFAWAMFDKDIGARLFLSATMKAREGIEMSLENGFFRLEAAIDPAFEQGKRYAKLMGFELEGMAVKYDGHKNYLIYSRTA